MTAGPALPLRPQVNGVFCNRKWRFSKALSKVEIFESGVEVYGYFTWADIRYNSMLSAVCCDVKRSRRVLAPKDKLDFTIRPNMIQVCFLAWI